MSDQKTTDTEMGESAARSENHDSIKDPSLISIASSQTKTYLEIYRITAEFLSKLMLPAVLIFIVLAFRPTIDSLLSRTTEAEIAGAKLKFVDKLSETLDPAIKSGNTKKIEAVVQTFQKEAAGDVIRSFWKPNGRNISRENEQVLRAWMAANRLGDQSITLFMLAPNYAISREKAVRELELAR